MATILLLMIYLSFISLGLSAARNERMTGGFYSRLPPVGTGLWTVRMVCTNVILPYLRLPPIPVILSAASPFAEFKRSRRIRKVCKNDHGLCAGAVGRNDNVNTALLTA